MPNNQGKKLRAGYPTPTPPERMGEVRFTKCSNSERSVLSPLIHVSEDKSIKLYVMNHIVNHISPLLLFNTLPGWIVPSSFGWNKESEHTPQTMQCSVRYPPGSLVRYPPGSLVVSYSTQLEQRSRTHTTDNAMLCQIPTREPCGVIFHSARTKIQNTHHRQRNALSDTHQGALWCHIPLS